VTKRKFLEKEAIRHLTHADILLYLQFPTFLYKGLDGRGFDFRQGLRIFLFSTASTSALELTQPI